FFFFQAEDGIRDGHVTGVQTCALPISRKAHPERLQVRLSKNIGRCSVSAGSQKRRPKWRGLASHQAQWHLTSFGFPLESRHPPSEPETRSLNVLCSDPDDVFSRIYRNIESY